MRSISLPRKIEKHHRENSKNYFRLDCRFSKIYSWKGTVHYYSQSIANSKVIMLRIKYLPVSFHLYFEAQRERTAETFSTEGHIRSEKCFLQTF